MAGTDAEMQGVVQQGQGVLTTEAAVVNQFNVLHTELVTMKSEINRIEGLLQQFEVQIKESVGGVTRKTLEVEAGLSRTETNIVNAHKVVMEQKDSTESKFGKVEEELKNQKETQGKIIKELTT